MLFDAFKKSFLEVHTKSGLSRLVLSKHAQRHGIQEFCNKPQTVYGFQITEAILASAFRCAQTSAANEPVPNHALS